MTEDEKVLDRFIKDTLNSSSFSDEMMEKVRKELLNAEQEAREVYKTKTEESKSN